MIVPFWTKEGIKKKMMIKAGKVKKTLIGVNRLNEAGNDVILNTSNPRIMNAKTKECINLRRNNGMYILDMYIWIGDPKENEEGKNKKPVFNRRG